MALKPQALVFNKRVWKDSWLWLFLGDDDTRTRACANWMQETIQKNDRHYRPCAPSNWPYERASTVELRVHLVDTRVFSVPIVRNVSCPSYYIYTNVIGASRVSLLRGGDDDFMNKDQDEVLESIPLEISNQSVLFPTAFSP